jgi:hypothetical protein
MQQKPKTTVKAKVKVKAKPAAKKPVTKATNKALRKEVIGKLKEKVVQTNAAPKMGMGSKGMPKMKSGSGCVSKYPDGSKKVKPTSTAARRASTATAMPAKRVGNIKTKEARKLDSLYNAKDNLDASIVFKEAIASGLDPKGFNSPKGQKNWNMSKANKYAKLEAETNKAETEYEDSWKKRNATLEKAVSGKMKSGTKGVKC